MFAHDPPSYCVAASVLIRYVLIMNCSVGHAVPDTSEVTVITDEVSCVVIAEPDTLAWPSGTDEVTAAALDGAVVTPARSDPHAIKGRTLMETAPISYAVFCLKKKNSKRKRRPFAA